MGVATCWVLDHPAHVQILAGFVRGGSTSDLIVATERPEVQALMQTSEGILPRRQTIWVMRTVGRAKELKAGGRLLKVRRALKGNGIDRVVAIGAAVELWAAKKAGVPERWYISDTEANHVAHRLALKHATHTLLPEHWREDIDGGFLSRFKGVVNRYEGLHAHIHLRPGLRPSLVRQPPRVLVRRLKGGGIHDDDEIIEIPESLLQDLDIIYADEEEVEEVWSLPGSLRTYDGVFTQSVTLASEAVIQGVPTLLVSKAERGFLDRLKEMGLPLHIERGGTFDSSVSEWLAGMHLSDIVEAKEWPPIREQWAELFGEHIQL